MANTYTQLIAQIIFTVKARECLIPKQHREELEKYISGIITKRNQKLLAIYAMPDHVHILIGLTPDLAISNLVRDIKMGSSIFISQRGWVKGKFNWQKGFGAFSYSKSQLKNVVNYILNQEKHHRKHTFREEYYQFLKSFEVDYNEKYLFNWIEF